MTVQHRRAGRPQHFTSSVGFAEGRFELAGRANRLWAARLARSYFPATQHAPTGWGLFGKSCSPRRACRVGGSEGVWSRRRIGRALVFVAQFSMFALTERLPPSGASGETQALGSARPAGWPPQTVMLRAFRWSACRFVVHRSPSVGLGWHLLREAAHLRREHFGLALQGARSSAASSPRRQPASAQVGPLARIDAALAHPQRAAMPQILRSWVHEFFWGKRPDLGHLRFCKRLPQHAFP